MNRTRYATIALLLVVFAGGCRHAGPKVAPPNPLSTAIPGKAQMTIQSPGQPVSSPDIFLSLIKQWNASLAGLTAAINDSYSQWSNNKIDRQEFLGQLAKIQTELTSLRMDADYKDFELSASDQQKIGSQEITKAYFMAEKDVNDFLYYAPHLTDAQLKAQYSRLILNQYETNIKDLQALLKS
jgi:hypothetical protein